MASHHGAIVTESIILSRIQLVCAGKLAASPTTDNCRNIASQMNERAQEIRSGLPSNLDSLPRLAGFCLRVFALGFTAIALEMVLLNLRAWQLREPLRLNAREQPMTFREVTGWSIPVVVGIASLALPLLLPREQIEWSGWIYFSMIILVPLHRAYSKRKR
jgi:hypothetical protein